MIPNTTPTPNELYNGEMKKMSDTELRVVLMVTRATLGWEINHETGMRKQEDWISHTQLIEKSGRSSRAISSAVDNCVKNGWIETRTQDGEILDTAEKRKKHGVRIYYRLGKIFLDKIETIATDAKVVKPSQLTTKTIATNDTKPSQKVRTTKETLTKEIIQKKEDFSLKDKIEAYERGERRYGVPYYKGYEIRRKDGKWWVLPGDNGRWLTFEDKDSEIEWLKK